MKTPIDCQGDLHLILMSRSYRHEPIGVHAAPPHLPVMLYRQQGETLQALANRAMQAAVGTGTVAARFAYLDELPPAGTVQ